MSDRRLTLSLVGIAHPMRGGIAQYTAILAHELARKHQVELVSFTRQYPSFLFPGKTQIDTSEEPLTFPARPMVDSINPLSWLRAASHIAGRRPDGILFKYWMPFFAPAFGTICRRVKSARAPAPPRVVMIVDNLIPHERRPGDLALTRWLMKTTDAYIVQSSAVREDLLRLDPGARFREVPHPVYNLFGQRQPREEARRALGIDPAQPCLLFFGFVRAYKGLDLLLWALALWRRGEATVSPPGPAPGGGRPVDPQSLRLLVVGEFYEGREDTVRLIDQLGLREAVTLQDQYVPNEAVRVYFSAADVVVLPYRSATQSGIVQIAYQLDRPVICTDVGGLREVVLDGRTGLVVPPDDPAALAAALVRYYAQGLEEPFVQAIREEKGKYSWDRMTTAVEELVEGA